MIAVTPKIKKNSYSHDILAFSKVYNKPITFKDIRYMNSKKYNDISRMRRSVLRLSVYGLITLLDNDHWLITPLGKLYLFELVDNRPSI